MAGCRNVLALTQAANDGGQYTLGAWHKVPTQVTVAGRWFDLSMSPGNPVPQYYAATPLKATQLTATDGGVPHFPRSVSPYYKLPLRSTQWSSSATGLPMPMLLCDYLLYYPFVDEGTTDAQLMDNTDTLPRYTDGAGVQIMAITVAARVGGQTFQVSYTNQDGTAGRTTALALLDTTAAIGSVATSSGAAAGSVGPFLQLQQGDTGVRSIESVTMVSGVDVGLFSLVLVKPLLTTGITEQTAPVEKSMVVQDVGLQQIQDNAYLNWLCHPNGSLSGVRLTGVLECIWS